MRSLILLSVLFCSVYSATIDVSDLDVQWELFKRDFDKSYATPTEEAIRKANFAKNLEFIESHNTKYTNGEVSHDVGVNQFSDWTTEERASLLPPMPALNLSAPNGVMVAPEPALYDSLPASFDWRSKNGVTPVKNQGQCGSCWAFCAVATIEAAYAIHKNQQVRLSEQQLVDCDSKDGGCNGGWVYNAYTYVQANGLESNTDYKYIDKAQSCQNNAAKTHVKVTGYHQLPSPATEEQIMTAIMNNGPLAINIDASGDDFGYYKSGILSTGGKNYNHYVTAVGWGSNYWIVKNSWGTQWGQQGYAQMARGVNIRGFNGYTFYPTV